MQILGIGTDIVECPRIGKMIEQHGELFLRRVYTEREIRYCQARSRALEHFAGRWAAKEAILKAIGTGWTRGSAGPTWRFATSRGGSPRSWFGAGRRTPRVPAVFDDIMISISHCRTYATAYALALGREARTEGTHNPDTSTGP